MDLPALGRFETALLLLGLLLAAGLAAADLKARRLPDPLTLALGLAGLGFHAAAGWAVATPAEALAGAGLGAALLGGVREVYRRRGVAALGRGDKLLAAAGAWVGPACRRC